MMLTHVIATLLLIGSLAAGVTCFTWSGGPEANSTVRPCPGDNVTLDWTFSLSDKDRLLSVHWYLSQGNKNKMVVGFATRLGSFFKVPDIKTRVEFLPPAGLRLYNVSTRDLGTYSVQVALYRNGRDDVTQRSVTLAPPHKPYLSESRLVASLEPGTVTVNGTSHARLTCGTILNHQDANFSVVWKTPGGQTVPSSGHSDGMFYLVLANPVEGGAYHCYLHGVTSLTCQHNGTLSPAGRVEVDHLQTRLMVLEASAARYDHQLLQVNSENTDLRAAMNDFQAKTQSLDIVDTELWNLTAEHTQQLNTIDINLRSMKTEHTQQLNTVDENLNALSTEITNLTATTAEQKQQLNMLDGKLTVAGQEHQEDKTALDKLKSLTEQLNNTVGRQERVITILTHLLGLMYKDGKVQHPSSCLEIKRYNDQDGVRTLSVNGHKMTVFCDQTTAGGGWTVIQRRVDGRVDFYRGWTEYREGFGTVDHEYWLGLENIHLLTKNRPHELRVDLLDFEGNTAFARYSRFSLDGESNNYRLTVDDFDKSSSAGDSLKTQNNKAFSTHDRDNDWWTDSCAKDMHGAWWYFTCAYSNLNGRYKPSAQEGWDGIFWYYWRNGKISLKKVEMKIRPV